MLEKPPGATLAEVHTLQTLASTQGTTLFATWHSRYAHAVAPAKAWLADKKVNRVDVTWHEDVRHWHPGQDWIFRAGGMGVFDTGINALSILTEILPDPFHVSAASLEFPENCETPIAVQIDFSNNMHVEMDWRKTGEPVWDIVVDYDGGQLVLRFGGNILEIDGVRREGDLSLSGEYPALYDRMATLVRTRQSDVDLRPMTHVADTLSLGKRVVLPPFYL
jgi:D-galactose 1-dehydrogenase